MNSDKIFCPKCNTLLLEVAQCPKCGWKRPTLPPGQDKRLLWETRFVEGVSSGLTWAAGLLFFLDGQGKLHALNTDTREEAWQGAVDFGDWRVHGIVAADEKRVVISPTEETPLPNADKAVVALESKTGRELWRQPLAERTLSDPCIAFDKVFLATSSHKAVALDLTDGSVLWERPIPGIFTAAPAAGEGMVFFGGDKGVLTAFHQEDGSPAWSYAVEVFGSWTESIPYTPVVKDGVVYFTCWNRKTYALDARNGDVIWISEPTKKRPPMTPPLVTDNTVYLAAHDRYVYALDRATGQERWSEQLPRRSEVQPLLVGDTLVVAARDHHVYALDAATGEVQEAPILTTGGKVSKAWAFDGVILYVVDELGKIYAMRLVEPVETREQPQALMAAGQWKEAAVAWALAGEYARSAGIYAEQLGQPFEAAQLYDKAEEPLLAAQQYERAGKTQRALERYRQARAWDKVAELSEELDDLLSAAQAYEHLGKPAKAGECYHALKKYPQAVAQIEQAARQQRDAGNMEAAMRYLKWAVGVYTDNLHQPVKAVMLLKEFGQREAATELLQTIPGWKKESWGKKLFQEMFRSPLDRARHYEKSGDYLLAAHEYIEAGEHFKAADLFARSEEYKLAAENYLAAGFPIKAAKMMERMQNWDEAAELYLQGDRPQEALQAYLRAGDRRHAAQLYARLGQWREAAQQWEGIAAWRQAAEAWEQAQEFERAARAWIQEEETLNAAENYKKAAQQHAQNHPHDDETLARYYELAMKQYEACGKINQAQFFDRQRRRYRKQPLIVVDAIRTSETLWLNEWGKLDVIISNRGWGQANEVRIQVNAQHFELDTSRLEAMGLAADGQARYTLWLKPKDAGAAVPLHLSISYFGRRRTPMPELSYVTDIRVRHADSRTSTPQVINVSGDYIKGDHIQKQVGDRVDIRRGGGGVSLQDGGAAPPAPARPSVPTISCAYCGLKQPATNPRCQNHRCGEPFIQCPNCGLYQPKNEREPEQFCQFCGGRI